jgi:hypothetical protein
VRNAESKSLDLGTHGKGFSKQTFLGSVPRSVLDRARKPVFIIPLPQEETGLTVGDIRCFSDLKKEVMELRKNLTRSLNIVYSIRRLTL